MSRTRRTAHKSTLTSYERTTLTIEGTSADMEIEGTSAAMEIEGAPAAMEQLPVAGEEEFRDIQEVPEPQA